MTKYLLFCIFILFLCQAVCYNALQDALDKIKC